MKWKRNSSHGQRQLTLSSNNKKVTGDVQSSLLDLAEATGEFGNALFNLSGVELDASLCNSLASLADLQAQIKELYDRQAQQDVLTLGNTVEEYLRTVGSIKTAFGQRHRVWSQLQAAEADFQKRQSYLDKVKRQAKTQQDRLAQMNADLADAEKKCHQLRLEFEETGKRLKLEMDRFEKEKVEDFKATVETFLEASIEGQKEVIYSCELTDV
jgi:sorting nexin-1/2